MQQWSSNANTTTLFSLWYKVRKDVRTSSITCSCFVCVVFCCNVMRVVSECFPCCLSSFRMLSLFWCCGSVMWIVSECLPCCSSPSSSSYPDALQLVVQDPKTCARVIIIKHTCVSFMCTAVWLEKYCFFLCTVLHHQACVLRRSSAWLKSCLWRFSAWWTWRRFSFFRR